MKYAILAAGEGIRLQNEGVLQAKPIVEINGDPMIKRLVRIFMNNCAEEIIIITNDLIKDTQLYVSQLIKEGYPIKLVVKTTTSSMHSFYELKPYIGTGKFCLTTVDTIFNEDEFEDYIKVFQSFSGDALMAVTDYIDDEKPLYTIVDSELNITKFSDTPVKGNKYISGGIYCMTNKSFSVLNDCINSGKSQMRNFQRQLISEGFKVKAYPFSKILDVDHASDILKAEDFLNSIYQ